MIKPLFTGFKALLVFCFLLLISTQVIGQRIDWAADTISKADAMGGRATYVNTIRGSGQLATEKVTLPVGKMKEIFDACYAQNITEVTVMLVAIRQSDMARFRKNNPEVSATNSQLKGRQMLVFRVPRRAFAAAKSGAGINIPNSHPLMLSLLAAGLMQIDASYLDLPFAGDDVFFSIGSICPPPASCDSLD